MFNSGWFVIAFFFHVSPVVFDSIRYQKKSCKLLKEMLETERATESTASKFMCNGLASELQPIGKP